jgi:hypothetical protein
MKEVKGKPVEVLAIGTIGHQVFVLVVGRLLA